MTTRFRKQIVDSENRIGGLIQKARQAANMSQHDLALAADVSLWTVSMVENGFVQPRFDTFEKLVRGLKCSLVVELRSDTNPACGSVVTFGDTTINQSNHTAELAVSAGQ